jgi:hypothetical protein
VDQTWFLDLVLLKGREVRPAKSPRDAVVLARGRGRMADSAAVPESLTASSVSSLVVLYDFR